MSEETTTNEGAFLAAYIVSMRIMAQAIRSVGDRERSLNNAMAVAMGIVHGPVGENP